MAETCAPCKERIGYDREVLTQRVAEQQAAESGGSARAFECPCEVGVWHLLQRRTITPRFSDSGPL